MCLHLQKKAAAAKEIGIVLAVLGLYLCLAVVHRGKPLPGDRDEDQDDY